jgi:phage regulator Rha-like protein
MINLCPYDFDQRNFARVEYKDRKGQMRPEYLLSRDGFAVLAMGFTGARALMFKLAYIKAFNALEQAPKQAMKTLLSSTPHQRERLSQVLGYKARGFTSAEIAKQLDLHPSTVNQIIRDARKMGLEV